MGVAGVLMAVCAVCGVNYDLVPCHPGYRLVEACPRRLPPVSVEVQAVAAVVPQETQETQQEGDRRPAIIERALRLRDGVGGQEKALGGHESPCSGGRCFERLSVPKAAQVGQEATMERCEGGACGGGMFGTKEISSGGNCSPCGSCSGGVGRRLRRCR